MIVTDIAEITKAKCRIYLDEEFAFVLYKGELRLYHIQVGQEMPFEVYEEIIHTVLTKRAKKRCLMLLQKKDYAEEELRRKLRQGEYPEEVIDTAIEYVKGYHYIDDYRYCLSFIGCYGDRCSRQQITTKLLTKGVSKECITKAFEEAFDKGDVSTEEELILSALSKKKYNAKEADIKTRQKMYRHLLYKGFSASSISKVLGEFADSY